MRKRFRRAAILGHMINDLSVVVHMQICWSSKIYYSGIVQVEEYVVFYRVLQVYFMPITEKTKNRGIFNERHGSVG